MKSNAPDQRQSSERDVGNEGRSVKPRLLLVEDDLDFSRSFAASTADHYDVSAVDTAEEALDRVSVESYDAVLLDLYLRPDRMDGIEFLDHALKQDPNLAVVLITVEEKADAVLAAIQRGAYGYAPKSLSFPEMVERVNSCLEKHRWFRKAKEWEEALREERPYVVPDHPLMKSVDRKVDRVAQFDSTVLLVGESGTGKNVIAEEIHARSVRSAGAFVSVNCGATPAHLMESEFFGSCKGGFTDARSRPGLIETARGGTLFLDELDKLDKPLQAKLLSVIEERELRRVGSSKTIKVDVRYIAASSRDLRDEVEAGRFLQELLNRFEVFEIRLPPLREMTSVIPEIARFYLHHMATKLHRQVKAISGDAMEILVGYEWPGNFREVRHTFEYAVIQCDGTELMPHHLPAKLLHPQSKSKLSFKEAPQHAADEVRRQMIVEALSKSGWKVPAAAGTLGVTPQALRKHMARLGIGSHRGDL